MSEKAHPESLSMGQRALWALGLMALIASAAFGGDLFGIRERVLGSGVPEPRPPAVSRVGTGGESSEETVLRSYPWWQQVETLTGDGSSTSPEFTIDEAAIQWRVTWTCESGDLLVEAAQEAAPVVDGTCPSGTIGYGVHTGPTSLEVTADGPWELVVEQQIDVPLEEPPLPEMTHASTLEIATSSFYNMDQSGSGRLTFYRLKNGRHLLRLEDFFVTPNVDLEIRLTPLKAPRTTSDYESAPSEWVAPLDITAGSLNFEVPKGLDPTDYRSVVIWCPPLQIAYTGATLEFTQ